jgi:alkylation response protein AidB-like acyl-CoA dehydrogenase
MPPNGHQNSVRDLARVFATSELVPHAAQWDRHANFPIAVRKMGKVSFLGLTASYFRHHIALCRVAGATRPCADYLRENGV